MEKMFNFPFLSRLTCQRQKCKLQARRLSVKKLALCPACSWRISSQSRAWKNSSQRLRTGELAKVGLFPFRLVFPSWRSSQCPRPRLRPLRTPLRPPLLRLPLLPLPPATYCQASWWGKNFDCNFYARIAGKIFPIPTIYALFSTLLTFDKISDEINGYRVIAFQSAEYVRAEGFTQLGI